MRTTSLLLALLCLALASCVDVPEGDPTVLDSAKQAISGKVPGVAYVPVPVVMVGDKPEGTWNGTAADLLAADALGACWTSVSFTVQSEMGNVWTFGDLAITELLGRMDEATCPAHRVQSTSWFARPAKEVLGNWVASRADPTCNYDLAKGANAPVDLQETRESLATYASAQNGGIPSEARTAAAAEVAYADLYLCMAQGLQEHTQSSFVFMASDEEVLRLYDFARSRALLAAFQYVMLAKTFAMPASSIESMPADQYGTVATLKDWLDNVTTAQQQAAGTDFALAIDTLAELTKVQSELLLRDASRASALDDAAGARNELLRTLYGDSAVRIRSITEDLGAPEIGLLLGFARRADALDFTLNLSNSPGAMSVDVANDALALLRAAERVARADRCAQGDLADACAQVTSSDLATQFDLFTRFGVRLEHAEALIRALSQTLFGPAADPLADAWSFAEPVADPAPAAASYRKIVAGNGYSCALLSTGRAVCWGSNFVRELGDGVADHPEQCGTMDCSTRPGYVLTQAGQALEDLVDISAGNQHTCALNGTGRVFCWGRSTARGVNSSSAFALEVTGLPSPAVEPVREISASGTLSCVVTISDRVYCWGQTQMGSLGDGTRYGTCTVASDCGPLGTCTSGLCSLPATTVYTARAASISGVASVYSGGTHACALKKNGDVFCWGQDDFGQLGNTTGTPKTCRTSSTGPDIRCLPMPAKINLPASVGRVASLALGYQRSCALTAKGEAYCWGAIGSYLGSAATSDSSCGTASCVRTPQIVRTSAAQVLNDVRTLSIGSSHACAVVRGGGGYCWGYNAAGVLGTGNTTTQIYATSVPTNGYIMLSAGSNQTCGLTAFGTPTARCFGNNYFGQLGNGTTTNSTSAVSVAALPAAPAFVLPTLTIEQRISRMAEQSRAPFHLLGLELRAGSTASQRKVHLRSDFRMASLSGADLQLGVTLRQVPALTLDPQSPAGGQGFLFRRFIAGGNYDSTMFASPFEWGSVPTLALAREAIIQNAVAGTEFGKTAQAALGVIDATIGGRSAILRKASTPRDSLPNVCTGEGVIILPNLPVPQLPADNVLGVCRESRAVQGGDRTVYQLSVVTPTTDLDHKIAFGSRVTHAFDKALTPGMPVLGSSNADLLATQTVDLGTTATFAGRDVRETSFTLAGASSVFFETPDLAAPSDRTQSSYAPLFDGTLRSDPTPAQFAVLDGVIMTYGGSFNALAAQAFQVRGDDWSRPKYDAYGLPTDWVPSADPALTGSSGEEGYQYFLRLAKQTATEATAAIKEAFEATQQEEIDLGAQEAADQRAAMLSKQETTLLCGKVPCKPLAPTEQMLLSGIARNCSAAERAGMQEWCDFQASEFEALFKKPLSMPSIVWNQRDDEVPYFADYAGGELSQSLMATWTALRRARESARLAFQTLNKGIADIEQSWKEIEAALYAVNTARAQASATYVGLTQQISAMDDQIREIKDRREAAAETKDYNCNGDAFERAYEAGRSFTDPDDREITRNGNHFSITFEYEDQNESFSKGPMVAQQAACKAAKIALDAADKPASRANLKKMEALKKSVKDLQRNPEDMEIVQEALTRVLVAEEHHDAVREASALSFSVSVSAIHEALAAFGAASTEMARAQKRTEVAKARYELDRALDSKQIQLRQGLRRRYQGLAQWRAEAMAENARRTAVLARRAIESRFVVDLKTMGGDEPLVAPPSLWVDEVYERDLKPPAAVGVTQYMGGDQVEGQDRQYANKLLDYVSNLELFVAGYSVKRPTAVARNDAELVSLPGPFTPARFESGAESYLYIDPAAAGWQLYCENLGTYVETTVLNDYATDPLQVGWQDPEWSRIATACDGEAPSHITIRFDMDPYGRVDGNLFDKPYSARFNARWRQVAVNLVGTGIRDCSKAASAIDCYAEPFLRYNLKHIGPAWVTNYDLQWRALKIPMTVIEGGKGLAIEEWLDPVSRGWNLPDVQTVARSELSGRPLGGTYELSMELTPDVRLERIERVQVLTSTDYWTRQQ